MNRRGFISSLVAAVVGTPVWRRLFGAPAVDPALTFSMDEFSRHYLQPKMLPLAQSIDAQLAEMYRAQAEVIASQLNPPYVRRYSPKIGDTVYIRKPARYGSPIQTA